MYMSLICKSVKECFMWINNNSEIDLTMNCIAQDGFACLMFLIIVILFRDMGTLHSFHNRISVSFRSRA